jgi:hypothetical protein
MYAVLRMITIVITIRDVADCCRGKGKEIAHECKTLTVIEYNIIDEPFTNPKIYIRNKG